jgi:hypothetical protein
MAPHLRRTKSFPAPQVCHSKSKWRARNFRWHRKIKIDGYKIRERVMSFVAVSAAAGTLLALLRGRVLLVILASAALAIAVTSICLALGYQLGPSALVGFGSIAAVQASYLALGLTLDVFSFVDLIPEVQTAIGQQLRTEFEVPSDLPPKMARLVSLLEAA